MSAYHCEGEVFETAQEAAAWHPTGKIEFYESIATFESIYKTFHAEREAGTSIGDALAIATGTSHYMPVRR